MSEYDTHNSIFSGRTGTRLNIGRAQVRWIDGVRVAETVVESRSTSVKGSNALSISSRIRESIKELRDSVAQIIG